MSVARRFPLLALVGGLVLAAIAALAVALNARAATTLPACAPGKLKLRYIDNQGAAGRRYYDFAFVNGGAKCTVKGYPRVVLLGKHGHALSAHVAHLPMSHATTVTVAHGKRAFFTVQWADGGFCPPPHVGAYKLRLFATGASSGTVYNLGGLTSMCKGSAYVWPLRPTLAVSSPTPYAAGAGSPTCAPASLRLDATGGQAFTSHREIVFALRNVTSQTCHLKGFPGVGLLDQHAALLSPTVTRVAGPKPTITLHTWQRAFFRVVYTVGGPCIPHTLNVYGLQVTPPNDTGHLAYYLGRTSMCAPPDATVTAVSHNSAP